MGHEYREEVTSEFMLLVWWITYLWKNVKSCSGFLHLQNKWRTSTDVSLACRLSQCNWRSLQLLKIWPAEFSSLYIEQSCRILIHFSFEHRLKKIGMTKAYILIPLDIYFEYLDSYSVTQINISGISHSIRHLFYINFCCFFMFQKYWDFLT